MPIQLASSTTADWIVEEPWRAWNNSWSQTYSTTSATQIWSGWNGDQWTVTTSAATTTQNIWVRWTSGTAGGTATVPVYSMQDLQRVSAAPRRTDEDWARIRAEREAERVRRDELQAAARAEAHKLLAFVLTKEQMASYEARRFFDVVGSEGGVYRIHQGTSGNIRQLINGREVNRLCVHPELYDRTAPVGESGYLPTEDCLAAQALALMHDEIGAVTTANVHEGRRHLRAVA